MLVLSLDLKGAEYWQDAQNGAAVNCTGLDEVTKLSDEPNAILVRSAARIKESVQVVHFCRCEGRASHINIEMTFCIEGALICEFWGAERVLAFQKKHQSERTLVIKLSRCLDTAIIFKI